MKKSKLIFTLLIAFVASTTLFAQSEKGEKRANLGLSLGYGLGVNGSLDVNVAPNISVGATGTFSNRSFGFGYNYSVFSVGARGAYHLGEILSGPLGLDTDKHDPYIGAGIVYTGVTSNGYSGTFGGINFGGVAGYRYFFKEKLGIYAEGGFPLSSIGLTFKL